MSPVPAREMEKKWIIDIREQCADADVAFFFKQWGGKRKSKTGRELEAELTTRCRSERSSNPAS